MEAEDWEGALYEGVDVQFDFVGGGPTWGDLVALCGAEPGRESPSSGRYDVARLSSLGFDGVDDYLGIRNEGPSGDDVIVWLFPIIDDEEVFRHPGPFEGLRLSYSVLRNPMAHVDRFLAAVVEFTKTFGVPGVYRLRGTTIGSPADLATLKQDIDAIAKHWRSEGIEPGSSAALEVDC